MIAALLLATAAPASADRACENPLTQQAMNHCAAQEYERADAALNAQWDITVAVMKKRDANRTMPRDKRPGHHATLLEAQRAWLKYRDAHCRGEGYSFRGGSMEPLVFSTCMTALTEERTKQLRALIDTQG